MQRELFRLAGVRAVLRVEHRQACPYYLRAENFSILKALADRVETRADSMTAYLFDPGRRDLDRYVLLDAQDW